MDQQVYTVGEVAALLKLHPVTVQRAIRRGDLKASRPKGGRRYLVSRVDLEAFFRKGGGGRLFEGEVIPWPKTGGQVEELFSELRAVVEPVELSPDLWSVLVEEWRPPFVSAPGQKKTEQILAIEHSKIALILWGSSSGFFLFAMPLERFLEIKPNYPWAFTRGARAVRALLKKEE
ncbi:MAG: helix-turn-helix domain-containing protein [Pseudomonadota bacterium]